MKNSGVLTNIGKPQRKQYPYAPEIASTSPFCSEPSFRAYGIREECVYSALGIDEGCIDMPS